jgi:hypothetical protein
MEPKKFWKYVGPAECASLEILMRLTGKKKAVSSKVHRKGEKMCTPRNGFLFHNFMLFY